MKAIILTYAPVSDFEREILLHTKIFKLALNQHAESLNPNARIITDYILSDILKKCSEKIISIREKLRCFSPRVEYPQIEFKGSTIIAGIEYLIANKYTEILIVGDNKVNSKQFQDNVNFHIDRITPRVNIYQYSKGNFNLRIKSIKDFIEKII